MTMKDISLAIDYMADINYIIWYAFFDYISIFRVPKNNDYKLIIAHLFRTGSFYISKSIKGHFLYRKIYFISFSNQNSSHIIN